MTAPPSTYPIKGIFFFFSNGSLIRRIICVLLLTLVVALLAIGLTFGFLLPLQAHALIVAGCPAWLAWIVSVIFCLLEAGIFTIIFYLIITPIWQDALFDDVLRLKGVGHVLEKRKTTSELTLCCRGFCSGISLAFATIYAIVITLLITIPLHAIPIIGTILYCYINGWVMTWGHQLHYHIEIKEWTIKQSLKFAWKNRFDYSMFGCIAVALELIPVANFIFFWTNVVGAALWTADVR
ncbi:hypothetical protein C1645_698694 [Glomus cerebriforme]|uniref:Etoposide-induced protein 2.4-domain-containing protein n=1 Tax=Glomus cerebriforme TaxID=658196 RepID=A0A397SP17_9GLOM|nr:hypothetical protein C1645_698694 [Glomus cerebriforme]